MCFFLYILHLHDILERICDLTGITAFLFSDVKNRLHFLLCKRENDSEKRNEEQIILYGGLIQNSENT